MAEKSDEKSWSFWDYIYKLRPSSWKSDTQLNQKPATRQSSNFYVPTLETVSKSSDWTDPHPDEPIHLRNPKLSLIFDNEASTPTPPPRLHKKGIREKIEAAAKSGLQAITAINGKKPVEEPLCVKKTIAPTVPRDHNCALRHHHTDKALKRRKNLSVISLPNYSELKLTHFDDIDLKGDEEPKKAKLENKRCRSFGSLLPHQLLERLRAKKIASDAESDDSFGGLEEDWDLRIIEHYNPKEASLPRPRKALAADVEALVEVGAQPVAPARRSESLLKKTNREAAGSAGGATPPPSPGRLEEHSGLMRILQEFSVREKRQDGFRRDVAQVEEFLHNEQNNVFAKFGPMVQT